MGSNTMLKTVLIVACALVVAVGVWQAGVAGAAESGRPRLGVKATDDFEVTGQGDNPAWDKAAWVSMGKGAGESTLPYTSRFKVLYSKTGLYVLMDGTDAALTSTMRADNLHLWEEDVFEVFLWTNEAYPVYFEYEISPLNYELPILVPNFDGQFLGWLPWDYEGARKTRKATAAIGGPKEGGAKVQGWRAEFFIPYELLNPLTNVPPKPGVEWRANFYRIDRDNGQEAHWHWAPVTGRFHQFEKFGTLVFE